MMSSEPVNLIPIPSGLLPQLLLNRYAGKSSVKSKYGGGIPWGQAWFLDILKFLRWEA